MGSDGPTPRCPACRLALCEVSAEAALGYCVVLDQCPQCRGVWCDRWELYPITAAAATRLDPVDGDALRQPTTVPPSPLECPRCRARLQAFRDAWLPADMCIGRCPNCDGLWLNRGQLRHVKSIPPPRSPSRPEHLLDATLVDNLAERLATAQRPLVRDLAHALDDPGTTDAGDDVQRDLLIGVAWAIVRALLRLTLRL